MKLPEIKADATIESGAPAKKTLWSVILTSTPVVLTVVATILAALSNGELTQAHYHRALAAQYQSKANDQWTFFQFKRSRGQQTKLAGDRLPVLSKTDKLEAATLRASAVQLVNDLQYVEKEVLSLNSLLLSSKSILGSQGDKLRRVTERLLQIIGSEVKDARALQADLEQKLATGQAQEAFGYLATDKLPPVKISALEEPRIQEALKAIEARKTEQETAPLIGNISEDALQHEISLAEGNVLAVEKSDKPVSGILEDLGKLIFRQAQLGWDLQRNTRRLESALEGLPTADTLAPLRASAMAVIHSGNSIKNQVNDLSNDFKATQYDYAVRRYDNEARHNQKAATLYEVQIRKASVRSESHRQRSRHFFYCMLIAQAGVTIASFSLAVKHKSTLWGLAALAGIGAIAISGYVYLYSRAG
jgi:hypothetical protein